jgi:hypothetical protein
MSKLNKNKLILKLTRKKSSKKIFDFLNETWKKQKQNYKNIFKTK